MILKVPTGRKLLLASIPSKPSDDVSVLFQLVVIPVASAGKRPSVLEAFLEGTDIGLEICENVLPLNS